MPFDLLKRVLPLRYQIKGLMTSKDTGRFLSLLPGAETLACWTWTVPQRALSPVWPQMDRSPGILPPPRPRGKSCTLTKTKLLGSDLICAGRKKKTQKPAQLVITAAQEESAPSSIRAL